MNFSKVSNWTYKKYNETIDNFEAPNVCPRCKKSIEPVPVSLIITGESSVTVTFLCKGCMQVFLSDYSTQVSTKGDMIYPQFVGSYPSQFSERKFDSKLIKLSPNFQNIYNQALQAEEAGLNEIAGMGYRKALEFLIKDYSCFLYPEDSEKIMGPKFSLSQCINTYVKADNLKDLSKLASWLGNDETHYTKVHETKDINDLKQYLDATVYFIMYDLIAKDAESIVNP